MALNATYTGQQATTPEASVFTVRSTFNSATEFRGFTTLSEAMAKATQYARANFTCCDVVEGDKLLARVQANGRVHHYVLGAKA
jgi:hypothetical protein